MKKFLSVLLAVVLAASFVTVAFAEDVEGAPVVPSDGLAAINEQAADIEAFGDALKDKDTDAVKGAIEDAFAQAKQDIKNLTFSDILSLPTNIMDDITTAFFALLKVLGVDVDAIYEKLASSKILNWIANFYKGGCLTKTTEKVQDVPATGSSAAIAVFATLSLAAAAAFVSYKKKEA